jgi:hypothetical protein
MRRRKVKKKGAVRAGKKEFVPRCLALVFEDRKS